MNEVYNPFEAGSKTEGDGSLPGGFPPSGPMGNDWGGGEEKVNRGNRGVLIIFLLILAGGGIAGYLWYKNHLNQQKWENEMAKALKLPDGQFEAAMRDILAKSDDTDILIQAAVELGIAKDVGAVDILAKTVNRGGRVGTEAAISLAKIGGEEAKVGIVPIFAQMQKADGLAKGEYAWALCTLGDDRGFSPLLESVSKRIVTEKTFPEFKPDFIARIATTDKLVQMAESPEPMLRMYAALELGFRTDGDAASPLIKLVADDTPAVAEAAAISLGRTTDPRAGQALLQAMNAKPAIRDSIINSIAQAVGAPGLEMIYKNSPSIEEKYKIIGQLKKLRDPRSADFLFGVLTETLPGSDKASLKQAEEIHNQALWMLEDLGDPRIAEAMYQKTQWVPTTEEQIPDEAVRYRQDDMARKIANSVITWFGNVRPPGVSDYLMKIYNENAPYSNSPECAKRVKVDSDPLFTAMSRTGDQQFCTFIRPFLDQDEGFFFQAASMALARLNCPGIAKEFIKRMQMTAVERKEEKFAVLLESRDWQMENRLQERKNSIIALGFIGAPEAGKELMKIVLDVKDDQELRKEAGTSLTYSADEAVMNTIIEKLSDSSIDIYARASLIQGLWIKPTATVMETMFKIIESSADAELFKAAAIVIGEAANPANQERLIKLLDSADENRRRAAVFALLLGGDITPVLDKVIETLQGQESALVLKEWYEGHQIYLTKDIFDSKRIYQRLVNARLIADKTAKKAGGDAIMWPWRHLVSRLKSGWEDGPKGLTALEVRNRLLDTIRQDATYRKLVVDILSGLNERGYLLALQSEKGPQGTVARDVLRAMSLGKP